MLTDPMRVIVALLVGIAAGTFATIWTVEATERMTVLCPIKIHNRGYWHV